MVVYSTVYVNHTLCSTYRTAFLIFDNISEMLKIFQLPTLYLYTLDNWIMPYFVTA